MAVAPPGEEPQTAVEPGSRLQRLNSHPSVLLAASTARTTMRNNGQSLRNVSMILGLMEPAIRQPTIVWAAI